MNFFDPAYKKHGLTKALSSKCLDHIYTIHPGFTADISVPTSVFPTIYQYLLDENILESRKIKFTVPSNIVT